MPDKVILIHNGALGDFLLAWPTAWALARAFKGPELLWAGASDRFRWLEPLGFKPCPPQTRGTLAGLYGAEHWPEALADARLFWPVVERIPDIPPDNACRFLRAVQGCRPVRRAYAADLALAGVPTPEGWHQCFQALFARARKPGRGVLLFPGAGHPLKQWPLVQFFRLADMLRREGLEPLFVAGPAEIESGMRLDGHPSRTPGDFEELSSLILEARAVVGADTGPMHLAGMLGVPGVSLFGPTRFGQWGPPGMREVNLRLPCSPCTAACADLDCPHPVCMEGIDARTVFNVLMELREPNGNGFQGPGIP